MERIIDIKVCGSRVIKDGDSAGNQGEANVTKLRITFDEEWSEYTKKVTFFDAYGANPTVISLNLNNREDISDSSIYLVPIPPECLTEQGKISFVVEGEIDNKIARGFTDSLKVGHVPSTNGAINSVNPTASDLAQYQAQLEAKFDWFLIESQEAAKQAHDSALNAAEYASNAVQAKSEAQNAASTAGEFAADSENSRIEAEKAKTDSQKYASESKTYAERAEEAAKRAENAGGGGGTGEPGKSPYIGDNGNWFEYNGTQYVDTGVKAQGEDGKPGFPTIKYYSGDILWAEPGLYPNEEVRCVNPVYSVIIDSFVRSEDTTLSESWSITFTCKNAPDGYPPSVSVPENVEWAVADPVFTEGYTYYLSFIPFGEKILGIWVAKELSAE